MEQIKEISAITAKFLSIVHLSIVTSFEICINAPCHSDRHSVLGSSARIEIRNKCAVDTAVVDRQPGELLADSSSRSGGSSVGPTAVVEALLEAVLEVVVIVVLRGVRVVE